MNKSEGGLINLDDSAEDIFGKVMALPDEAILPVAEFSTEMPMPNVEMLRKNLVPGGMNPRDAKIEVALAAAQMMYGKDIAEKAKEKFIQLFSKKETVPSDIPVLQLKGNTLLLDLVVSSGVVKSKSEARRLVTQGGVKVNDVAVADPTYSLGAFKGGEILKVGKHHFFRILK